MATMASLSASSSAVAVAKAQQQLQPEWRGNAVRLVANAGARPSGRRASGVRCEGGQRVGFLGRLGRVFKEKAKSDIQLLFSGFSKTRENLAVVDELLTYWNLDESENILDELEEVCLMSIECVFASSGLNFFLSGIIIHARACLVFSRFGFCI
jgi:fused signal recognition particle receptor